MLVTVEDVDDLALGAVVLGAGGGGNPRTAKLVLRETILRNGPVRLTAARELDPEGLVLPIAGIGAPTASMEKLPNGREGRQVVEALQRHLGKKAVAIMAAEVGGSNTLLPLTVASELGLPCVDADTMGRAFPQIEMTLLTLDGISASPLALADSKGNSVVLDAVDNSSAERLIRACVAQMGMTATGCLYPLTVLRCREHALFGSVSRCLEIGRRVRAVQTGGMSAYEDLLNFCAARTLFGGKVVDVDRRTTQGWTRGTVTLEHLDTRARRMQIEFQNENLVALEDGVPVATVPDLITFLDVDTGIPITTDAVAYGQRLHVIGMPAHERWHTEQALALVGPQAFGYDFPFTPVIPAK